MICCQQAYLIYKLKKLYKDNNIYHLITKINYKLLHKLIKYHLILKILHSKNLELILRKKYFNII